MNSKFIKIKNAPWMPIVIAFFGVFLYLIQSVYYAHTSAPMLDEGLYLYKGWLFVTDQYFPYQEYGPWTNHAPLSFLIPGYVQLLFGAGVRTGRYFMVFISIFLLLGMWLISKRVGGRWGAALAIWAFVLTPHQINLYSKGISQLLVATLLTWILYFILGENRSWKEIAIGAFLAAMMVLVRENMVILIPFMALYVLWQHGWRSTLISGLIFLVLTGIAFAYYWPGILQVWIRWLPAFLLPTELKLGLYAPGEGVKVSALEFWIAVFQSTRVNLIALLGFVFVVMAWPKNGWGKQWHKSIVFLILSMLVLYLAHAWGSLGNVTCPKCLNSYIPFFSPIGVLLLVFYLTRLSPEQSKLSVWVSIIFTFFLSAGVGLSMFEKTGSELMQIPIWLWGRETPIYLWQIIANKYLLSTQQITRLLPFLAGLLVGLIIILVGIFFYTRFKKPLTHSILITLLFGSVAISLSDAAYLSKGCDIDVISTYERIGSELSKHIEPESSIFWKGYSPVTLLYLPTIKIYPAQLNLIFSYREHTSNEISLKYGFWNDDLAETWLNDADYLFLTHESQLSAEEWAVGNFNKIEMTEPNYGCYPELRVQVFKREN